MKLYKLFIISLTITLGCNSVEETKTKTDLPTNTKLDSLFQRLEEDGLFNGEVLVFKDKVLMFHDYYGYENFDLKTRFTENSIFELASVSKPFTALAIAKLVSGDNIKYSDFVKTYIPELPYDSITIEQLVNHTSGLPDYAQVLYPNWDYEEIADNENLLNILIREEPELSSKGEWNYSNIGYTLLAIIIEYVSNKTYPEFLEENIFNPLGMNNTKIPSFNEAINDDNYVDDYVFSFGKADYVDPGVWPSFDNATFTSDMYGAQGICTNALDLLIFTNFFENQIILTDSVFQIFISPQNLSTPMSEDFTRGWFYDNDSINGSSYFYVGGFSGYRSFFQYYPKSNTTIILLSNTSTTPVWSIKKMINELVFGKNVQYPKKSFVRAISNEIHKNKIDSATFNDKLKYDTSIFVLKNDELDELIDDLKSENEDTLAIIAMEKVLTYFPNNEYAIKKKEELTIAQQ